jgi:hypothetical protein
MDFEKKIMDWRKKKKKQEKSNNFFLEKFKDKI